MEIHPLGILLKQFLKKMMFVTQMKGN